MRNSYQVLMVTAVILSAALLLAPAPGLGQNTAWFEARARWLTVFDREGNVVNTLGERDMYHQPSFSPDGTRVAVIRGMVGNWNVWVFDVATGNGTQITSSRRAESPVWSPDGSQIAYVAVRDGSQGLFRQASNGEGEEELLYEHVGGNITLTDWSLDGRFLSFFLGDFWYSTSLYGSTLYLLPLDGDGQVIEVARSESILVEARLSPDSRFLAYRSDETGRSEIFVRSVALSGDANVSVDTWQVSTEGGLGMASWRRDGQELYYFGADRGVMAVAVNTAQGFEFGRPRRVFKAPDAIQITDIQGQMSRGSRIAFGNVSRDGQRFVFAVPPVPLLRQITVLDREGNVVSRLGEPGLYQQPAFSPDGSRVAVLKQDPETGNEDVWTFDVSTGEGEQVTSHDSRKDYLVWSGDGTHVIYWSSRDGYEGVYRTASNGEGSEELLWRYTLAAEMALQDYSADGRFLSIDGGDIVLVVPLTGTDPLAREAIYFVQEEFSATGGWFSPDSRFIAYRSDESGSPTMYVRPFDASSGTPPTEEKWQVTEDLTPEVYWRQDGKELLYLTQDRDAQTRDLKVMAVDVTTTPEFQVGTPRLLFRVRDLRGEWGPSMRIRPDGQRFIFAMPVGGLVEDF